MSISQSRSKYKDGNTKHSKQENYYCDWTSYERFSVWCYATFWEWGKVIVSNFNIIEIINLRKHIYIVFPKNKKMIQLAGAVEPNGTMHGKLVRWKFEMAVGWWHLIRPARVRSGTDTDSTLSAHWSPRYRLNALFHFQVWRLWGLQWRLCADFDRWYERKSRSDLGMGSGCTCRNSNQ